MIVNMLNYIFQLQTHLSKKIICIVILGSHSILKSKFLHFSLFSLSSDITSEGSIAIVKKFDFDFLFMVFDFIS